MDTSTKYLGLPIKNPVVISSSQLTANYDKIMECVDNGAAAITLKSLFEEQIIGEIEDKLKNNDMYFWFPEASNLVKDLSKDHGVNEYIKLLKKVKSSSPVPVIPSINCISAQEWPEFAKELQDAGADALELNIALFPFNAEAESNDIENVYVDIVREVKKHITIPVVAKIGHYFTNIPGMVSRLSAANVDGIVLFNRYFRPDINIYNGEVNYKNYLSNQSEMTMSLRWIGVLGRKTKCDLIANTGIHEYQDVIKQIMAGATAVQICSVLYKKGIPYLKTMIREMAEWMENNKVKSLEEIKGKIHLDGDNSAAFERIQFMKRTTSPFSVV